MNKLTEIDDIEVEVYKKNIKNLHLYVMPPYGKVRVTAPYGINDEAIHMFVASKARWIKKHQEKFTSRPIREEPQYVTGESIYIWGSSYLLEVIYSNSRNNVHMRDGKIILQVRKSSTKVQRAKVLNEWYRENMRKVIPEILERWQEKIGVAVRDWGIKNMKTRWGTCNVRDKRIWLNLQLAGKHPRCLEYVVVHELLHLLERKHNKIFDAYMDKFLPEWRTIKDELNGRNGNM